MDFDNIFVFCEIWMSDMDAHNWKLNKLAKEFSVILDAVYIVFGYNWRIPFEPLSYTVSLFN